MTCGTVSLEKNQNKISPVEPAAPALITDSPRCPNETAWGTEETAWGHVAKLSFMCTFGQPYLISPGRPHPPAPVVDTSPQRALTTPSEAKIRPPPTDEATNTYVFEALTGHKPGTDGIPLFSVRWYEYTADNDTWEPANYKEYCSAIPILERGVKGSEKRKIIWMLWSGLEDTRVQRCTRLF